MRRRLSAFTLALALLLLCAACTGRGSEGQASGDYTFWFAAGQADADGAVLATETRTVATADDPAQALLQLLLAGPKRETLLSPFPAGLTVRSVSVTDGVATVDLSEGYGGLSGVELTLADSCIVLTLCQLEGIDAVYLTVDGAPRPFRDQVLTPEDFLLDNRLPSPTPT